MDVLGVLLILGGALWAYQSAHGSGTTVQPTIALGGNPYGPPAPSVAAPLVTGTQSQATCMAYATGNLGAIAAGNPNARQQMSDWQNARLIRGEDAWDWSAFRSHARGIGAPDPGGAAPVEFCAFAPRVV